MHALKCKFTQYLPACNLGTAQWKKTWFQAHIVEQLKSYPMVVESWESDEANLDAPLLAQGTFFECLQIACQGRTQEF